MLQPGFSGTPGSEQLPGSPAGGRHISETSPASKNVQATARMGTHLVHARINGGTMITRHGKHTKNILKIAIEIVDFPINSMVDLSMFMLVYRRVVINVELVLSGSSHES